MSEVSWSKLVSIAVITSLLTCGILIPFWLIGLSTIWLIKMFNPAPIKSRPIQPIVILPNNDFVDDWDFRFYEVEK